MQNVLKQLDEFMSAHLSLKSRVLVLGAVVILLLTYAFPLYNMTLKSNFYPTGLHLHIYSYKLESGNDNKDLREINVLNHYIGMKEIKEQDIPELSWLPLAFGIIALLTLRIAVIGEMSALVDVIVLTFYVSVFGLYRFGKQLYDYGHNLSPTAAIKVDGFMPPVIGSKQIANFYVTNMPGIGAVLLALFMIVLILAIFVSKNQELRRKENEKQKDE
jgi:hypothetical protein